MGYAFAMPLLCLECLNNLMKNIQHKLIYAFQIVNVKNINMLIQKWKNDNNLCNFSQFYHVYNYFSSENCSILNS